MALDSQFDTLIDIKKMSVCLKCDAGLTNNISDVL